MTDAVAQQGMRRRRRHAGDPALVVGYVRVSTEEQALGPAAQREALESWCRAQGARLVAVHEDLGVSGKTEVDRRPGLCAALATLRDERAGVLLVAKHDRLARDVLVAVIAEQLVIASGARLLAADGVGNGDGPEAALMRTIASAFAQYERALIAMRTKVALAEKRKRGEKTGGDVPYGFRLAADGVHLERDEHEAAAVALAKELRAQGLSLSAIGRRLEAKGHRPRRGGSWHPMTLHRAVAAA